MNNSSSTSSSLVLKIKRNTAKQQVNDSLSRSSPMPDDEDDDDDNRQSTRSSSTQSSRLKRPNSITSTRRPSSPAFNGKQQQQGTKRSVTIDNNNNDLPSHLEEISARKRFKPDDCNVSRRFLFVRDVSREGDVFIVVFFFLTLIECDSSIGNNHKEIRREHSYESLMLSCFTILSIFCLFFSVMKQSSSNKVDASVETVSVGLATEPDHLGPCEPVCYFSLNLISFR